MFLLCFDDFGYELRDAGKRRNPSRIIALMDVCVFGFMPCTFHGNLGRFRAAGDDVALVAE